MPILRDFLRTPVPIARKSETKAPTTVAVLSARNRDLAIPRSAALRTPRYREGMDIPGLAIDQDLAALSWRSTSVPGVDWIPLALEADGAGGNTRGASSVLIRMQPGVGYERHRHLGPEAVLVLQGGYRDEMGEYSRGRFVQYPTGSVHSPVALGDCVQPASAENPACVLFAVAAGGIELLGR